MKTLAVITTLFLVIAVQLSGIPGQMESKRLYAQSIKEQTLDQNGSTIKVRVIGQADIVKVKPYIKAKKGEEEGTLYLDVVIKNTATEPQAYSIFGQGKTDTGGWLGGMNKVPKKGKLDPGKEVMTKIKTRYEGKSVPKEIRVEVFNPQ